jgi:hypothetical protein
MRASESAKWHWTQVSIECRTDRKFYFCILWCKEHESNSRYYISTSDSILPDSSLSTLRIYFEDPKDALMFKLAN